MKILSQSGSLKLWIATLRPLSRQDWYHNMIRRAMTTYREMIHKHFAGRLVRAMKGREPHKRLAQPTPVARARSAEAASDRDHQPSA